MKRLLLTQQYLHLSKWFGLRRMSSEAQVVSRFMEHVLANLLPCQAVSERVKPNHETVARRIDSDPGFPVLDDS